MALLGIFAFSIIAKATVVQFRDGRALVEEADSLIIFSKKIEPERGNIYTEDGRLLSTSLPYFEIRMDFQSEAMTDSIFLKNVDSLAYTLAKKIGNKTQKEYLAELNDKREKGNRYYLIKKNVNYPELKEMKEWPFFKLGRYKSGMVVIQKIRRDKPFGLLAERTIGYMKSGKNDDGTPWETGVGIERTYDKVLAGTEGRILMQKISGGAAIPLNERGDVEPQPGKDIYTTIDVNIQDIAEYALLKNMHEHNADHGCVVVMEVATGKIKAIANLKYNQSEGEYLEDYNYAVGEKIEPGSTFKVPVMAALLEDGYANPNMIVNIEGGKKKYADQWMYDAHQPEDDSDFTLTEVFKYSSNVGISKLVVDHYSREDFYNRLRSFGLMNLTGVEIKGEATPMIKKPEEMSYVSMPWMSIGYELEITPLQLLTFYNAVANNGKMMKPYLVESIREYGRVDQRIKPVVLKNKLLTEETITSLKAMMEAVVESGTARNVKVKGLRMAGKTGTSKVADQNNDYDDNIYQASFAGFFPVEEPLYSCIVVVNNPRNRAIYGSEVAAPVFAEIAQKIYSSSLEMHEPLNENNLQAEAIPVFGNMNIESAKKLYNFFGISFHPNNVEGFAVLAQNDMSVQAKPNLIEKAKVPYVVGMSISDALYVLENAGLQVELEGMGKVYAQSFNAGEFFKKGQTITIKLK